MKKLIILSLALLIGQALSAQKILRFGPRVSMTSTTMKAGDLIVTDMQGLQDLKLSFQDSDASLQFGGFARLELLGLYVQPELMFGSTTMTYTWESPDPNVAPTTREEQVYNVNMPVLFGTKVGPIRLQGGPVYSFNFGEKSDLTDIDGYKRQFDKNDFDIRAGIGADLGPIILDLTYQIPLSSTQNVIEIDGLSYNINQPKGHLVGSLGFAF